MKHHLYITLPVVCGYSTYKAKILRACILLALLSYSLIGQAQTIRYVRPTASGSGTGSSWANASSSLQAMINASSSGQQVWVAQGTYKPTTGTDRTISFAMKDGVTIYGGFAATGTPTLAQRNPDSFITILSGDIGTSGSTSDNSYHIINNPSGLTTTAVLDGFVLRDGNANGSGNSLDVGAGIYNSTSSPTITNCTFLNNFASSGGGAIWLDAYSGGASNMIITDCSFSSNTAAQGGAVFNGSSNPTITGCSFQHNTTPFLRTAPEWGGAIANNGGSATITNCTFVNNAAVEAGAIRNEGGSNSTISNCSFQGNTADSGGGIYNRDSSPTITNALFENNTVTARGGAVVNSGGSPTLTYCSFIGNTANSGGAIHSTGSSTAKLTECLFRENVGRFGGALRIDNGTMSLTNCSFQNNTANNQGGIIYNGAGTASLTNCAVFGNGGTNTILSEVSGAISASYSLFDTAVTGYTGSNNLTTRFSPFISVTDSRLNGCAPAINTGLNSATGLSGITTDLAGSPRRYNSGVVDMGAYEYQGTPTTITTTNPAVTTASVGSSFSQSFAVSGGSGPYSFSLASGSLPTGLSLNTTTGVLSGTPTQSGTFPIVIQGWDANGCSDLGTTYTLVVNSSVPTITGFTTLDNTVCAGSPITFTATVGNVSGSYNFTVTNGTIGAPTGTTTGTSSNTAFSQNLTASGSANQTFTLTINDNSQSASATTNVTVNSLPTAGLTNNGPLSCTLTTVTLTASGGSSYTFVNGSGTVLPGSGNTRSVTTSGTYSVTVANASGCVSTTSTTVISTTATVTVSNPATTTATLSSVFSQSFTASGGTTPRSFSIASGSLPTGLSLSTTGVLSGTPTQNGSFPITVKATDANGCSGVSATYTLMVNVACSSTFTVTNTNDAGAGSLRQAMLDVAVTTCPGPFTITATASGTINLASVLPDIVDNVTFIGPGASNLTVRRSSGGNYRIFNIPNTNTVSFNGFTIAGGNTGDGGGAINNNGQLLTLTNCIFSNNTAYYGGVITNNEGSLLVNNCLFINNTATGTDGDGGAISLRGSGGGTFSNTSFVGNQAEVGGAFSANSGVPVFINCTFSNNTAYNYGGALILQNGGTLSNCTITANTSKPGYLAGDGLFIIRGPVLLKNCIIAGNIGGNNIYSNANSVDAGSSYNLIAADYNVGLANGVNGNIVTNANPLLAPLGDYGGPFQTHALLPGSPAINAGTDTGAPTTDQRGISRVGVTDIGSFESRGFIMALTSGNNQSATVNTAFASPLVVTVSSANAEPVAGGVVTFTGPGSGASINPASGTASIGTTTASASVTANATVGGPYSVTASTNGASPNRNFSLTNTIGAPTITGFTTLDNTICVGSPMTFTATVGNVSGSYNFTVTNGTSTTTGTSANMTFSQSLIASGSGNQTFTLTINDNSQSASATTSVTVNSLPTAGLSNNGPLSCTLTTVTLTATGGNSYTFANGSGTVLPGSGNTRSVTTAGTYSVTVANASGCVSTTSTTLTSTTATVTVSNPATTNATQGTAFSQTFTASGGSGPYNYSLASGSLPTGLSVSTTGVLSGTPAQSGSFPITVRATDANGCSGVSATYTLVVNTPAPLAPTITGFAVNPSVACAGSPVTFTATIGNLSGDYGWSLSNGGPPVGSPGPTTATAYSVVLTANGTGVQTYTLTVTSGGQSTTAITTVTVNSLPTAGLTTNGPLSCAVTSVTLTASGGTSYTFANGSGTLGTPGPTNTLVVNSPGTYSVTVANASGCVSTTTTTVLSATGTVMVNNPAITTATLSSAFSQSFTASGGSGPYSYSLASGSLPIGLSLSNTGVLSGTPTQSGSFPITIKATDGNGCSGVSATYTLVINDPTPTLAGFAASSNAVCVGSPVTFTATIGNVSGSYAYTLSNGLSSPLTGTSSNATFSTLVMASGTGAQSFTLTVNANGQSATATTGLTVNSLPTAGLVSSGALSCAVTSVTLTASGGTSYTFANGSGTLGTPGPTNTLVVNSPGTYSVTVANASGCVSTTTTTVLSATGTVTVSNPATTNATLSSAFSQSFTASGGSGPYSYSLVSGSLPTGLSLSTTGVLSGTPTQSGSFPITVRATDVNGCSGVSATYTLAILGGSLTVTAPDYNCATGAITFHTTGGDGSPIEYFAIGVTPWTTNPNQTVEINLQSDPKKFTIYARQSGIQVSYLFDLPAYCAGLPTPPQSSTSPEPINAQFIAAQTSTQYQPYSFSIPAGTFTQPQGLPLTYYMLGLPSGLSFSGTTISGTPTQAGRKTVTVIAVDASGQTANTSFSLAVNPPNPPAPTADPFQLLAPVYNCSGGWITFQTTGGNGSPVEYYAEGITDWTSSAILEVSQQLRDHPTTILLKARQNGVEVSRLVDLASLCQPDLIPLLSTSPSTVYGTSNLNVVVDVVELNSRSSNGLIQVYIAKDPLFTLSFEPATSLVAGHRVQNSVWSFDGSSNGSFYILSTTGLGAGDKVSVGLSGQLRPGNTKGRISISALVMGRAIGELQLINNSDADMLEYFNK